ncbi:hypothetical protein AYY18_01810 [Morganella psychrotolerans]|uniref:Uncharacterized protein n=1 Tax=Morganella psychrotolerans TaxID=368603 RepID=A0A1B8HUP6_9GAMM|nr:hypothetical protein AYY18_01810 [Morganella psychrotolerans]
MITIYTLTEFTPKENAPVNKPGHFLIIGGIYPTSFKMQEGGKGKQTGHIHQYVTRLVDRSQHTCSLNE